MKLRHNRNAIKALRVGDEWVQSPMEVRRTVVDYFSNHVAASVWSVLNLLVSILRGWER